MFSTLTIPGVAYSGNCHPIIWEKLEMKKAQRILDFLHNKENKLLYQISKDHIFKYKKTLLILFVLIILGVGLGNLSPYLYG